MNDEKERVFSSCLPSFKKRKNALGTSLRCLVKIENSNKEITAGNKNLPSRLLRLNHLKVAGIFFFEFRINQGWQDAFISGGAKWKVRGQKCLICQKSA